MSFQYLFKKSDKILVFHIWKGEAEIIQIPSLWINKFVESIYLLIEGIKTSVTIGTEILGEISIEKTDSNYRLQGLYNGDPTAEFIVSRSELLDIKAVLDIYLKVKNNSNFPFYIRSKQFGENIEVPKASHKNFVKLRLHKKEALDHQKWYLKMRDQDNIYSIIAKHSNKTIDNTATHDIDREVHQWAVCYESQQDWEILFQTNGTVKFKSKFSNLYLSADEQGRVIQSEESNSADQEWELIQDPLVDIALKFSQYQLLISHNHIEDIGKFAIFCLKAIHNGQSIEDISNVTNIDMGTIKRQLHYLVTRAYLNEEYEIIEDGESLVAVYEFIECINNSDSIVGFDHYVENIEDKNIYFIRNKVEISNLFENKSSESKGIILNEVIYQYKLERIFNEINQGYKDKLLDLLKNIVPNRDEFIDSIGDELDFKITFPKFTENVFYKNILVDASTFMSLLSEEESAIMLAIPVKRYKIQAAKDSENNSIGDFLNSWLQENVGKLQKQVSLIDGEDVDENVSMFNRTNKNFGVTELKPLITPSINGGIEIPMKILFSCTFSSTSEIIYQRKYISEVNLNRLITGNYGSN